MTQVLKPCPRQGRQGRLCKASEGVEEERKAWKDRDPWKVTEGPEWREASGTSLEADAGR